MQKVKLVFNNVNLFKCKTQSHYRSYYQTNIRQISLPSSIFIFSNKLYYMTILLQLIQQKERRITNLILYTSAIMKVTDK